MQTLVKVIDADFYMQDGYIESVKVWHESLGQPLQLDKISGNDFWGWLPLFVRQQFKTLMAYWDATHPLRRDEHIAEYLLDRSLILQLDETLTY